jgi:hypothetical protein
MNDNEQRETLEQAIKQKYNEWRVLDDRCSMLLEQQRDTGKEMLRLMKMLKDLDAHASK